jgi:hypothetical protein
LINGISVTDLSIIGQSQSVYFKVGAFLEYTQATSGEIVRFGGTTSTVLGKLYYLGTASWNLCSNNAASSAAGLLGIALGLTSSISGMLVRGNSSLTFSSYPIGDTLYLSTNGDLTNVAPTNSGQIQRIAGYSRGVNQLYFCPDNTWVQLV